jgi:hypothetical protein
MVVTHRQSQASEDAVSAGRDAGGPSPARSETKHQRVPQDREETARTDQAPKASRGIVRT